MNRIIIIILVLLSFSCKKEEQSSVNEEKAEVVQNEEGDKSNRAIKQSSKLVDNWEEIIALESEVKRVVSSSIKSEKDVELLKGLIIKLKDSYPERFKTMAIETRVKVLETEVLMLEQDLKLDITKNVNERLDRISESYNIFVEQIEALIIKEKDYEKYQ